MGVPVLVFHNGSGNDKIINNQPIPSQHNTHLARLIQIAITVSTNHHFGSNTAGNKSYRYFN